MSRHPLAIGAVNGIEAAIARHPDVLLAINARGPGTG